MTPSTNHFRKTLESAALNGLPDHVLLAGGARAHGINQGQRWLALGKVVAEVLAEFLGRGVEIKGVVDELKSAAQVPAVLDHCRFHCRPAAGEHRG